LSQISLAWQRGLVGKKCNWQHSMAHFRKLPYRRKNLLRKPIYSPFCPNFVAVATGIGRGKCNWQHSMAHPRKRKLLAQKFRKNLLRKPSYSPSCPKKFCCHGNRSRSRKNAIGIIRWPISENPPIGAKISQISLTQAEL